MKVAYPNVNFFATDKQLSASVRCLRHDVATQDVKVAFHWVFVRMNIAARQCVAHDKPIPAASYDAFSKVI